MLLLQVFDYLLLCAFFQLIWFSSYKCKAPQDVNRIQVLWSLMQLLEPKWFRCLTSWIHLCGQYLIDLTMPFRIWSVCRCWVHSCFGSHLSKPKGFIWSVCRRYTECIYTSTVSSNPWIYHRECCEEKGWWQSDPVLCDLSPSRSLQLVCSAEHLMWVL
jgi:hypothetical protein